MDRMHSSLARQLPLGGIVLALLLAGCSDSGPSITPPPPVTPPDTATPPPPPVVNGRQLFDEERFGGNSRTCLTCHSRENGTITVQDAARRFATNRQDELFLHDALDADGEGLRRFLSHATIAVEIELPPYVTLADEPGRRSIIVNRGIATTLNAPAFDGRGSVALMLDLRDSDLQKQALGAIRGHAQSTVTPTAAQLTALATFQQTDARFFSSPELRAFAAGGAPPQLPDALTESEARGRLFFIDTPMLPGSKPGSCAMCHSGPGLNQLSQFGAAAIPGALGATGAKFGTVFVAETNALDNPTYRFQVSGPGGVRTVIMADPGIMLTERTSSAQLMAFTPNGHRADFAGFFKTPTLWAIRHTPPYFHDNSAKTLREVVDHYADVFFVREQVAGGFITLSEQDRRDIVAFLERF
jgi:hypothetical protein